MIEDDTGLVAGIRDALRNQKDNDETETEEVIHLHATSNTTQNETHTTSSTKADKSCSDADDGNFKQKIRV